MAGQGRVIGGLVLCLLGILGVGLACGLPMWRESSFVGPNIVSAQTLWDGLWLHCVVQSTGQMQCKKPSGIRMTTDLTAGRALTLLSIIIAIIGVIIAILGGGVANCSGEQPEGYYSDAQSSQSTEASQGKAALLGGLLCVIAGILCLVAVIWSAALTAWVSNDPLVVASMKRDVGTSIYIGLAAGILLLVGGAVICMVCKRRERRPQQVYKPQLPPPVQYTYTTAATTPTQYYQYSQYSRPPSKAQYRPDTAFYPGPQTPLYRTGPRDRY